ncbi:SDR family NAD(P)-dependent oxidoreductase [Novipirellula artificiosorum]|uniref:Gluconate 5-dehydrogenase n=1 Tax=Novipirellula artificiosorum TaxID=2528016 RepID=A0A5C6E340_9BACT|nr:SDR family oxidoreductase [Novipirellula artificiosorum]TWU42377.1 Gluconate 5-dehydrogenase [Novipirellula artificiosorum]
MSSLPSFSLQDKVVVVTGAGRGIGRTIAWDAHKSGARIAVGSRTTAELESLADEIEQAGGQCFAHVLDVTDIASIHTFMAAVVKQYGRLDVLINNAGYNKQQKILDYDEQQYDLIVDSNLKSVFFCSQVVARQMMAQGDGGSIVNISSQAGVVGAPDRGPYSGAKGGVNNLTRTMAAEWAEHGIRVNAVAPTVTRTPMAEQAMKENPAFFDAVRTKNLLRLENVKFT